MGYGTRRREPQRVDLSEPGYWAMVKPLDVGGQEKLTRDAVKQGVAQLNASGNLVGEGLTSFMLPYVITAWNLDDDAGAPLPVNRESCQRLFTEDVAAIMAVAGAPARTAVEQRDFSGASEPGPADEAQPLTASHASAPTASSGASSA